MKTLTIKFLSATVTPNKSCSPHPIPIFLYVKPPYFKGSQCQKTIFLLIKVQQ